MIFCVYIIVQEGLSLFKIYACEWVSEQFFDLIIGLFCIILWMYNFFILNLQNILMGVHPIQSTLLLALSMYIVS